jgi:two-component system phosphate regulon response regulator PhoB
MTPPSPSPPGPITTNTPPADSVLVVDDESDLRRLLDFNLTEAGFAVVAVHTGQAALNALQASAPSVVLLDLMLPDIPGTEVCRRMRADARLQDVGVIMLTARSDEYDRVLGFELGTDDYVVKPFSVREVVLRVRALCRRVGERKAARQAADAGNRLVWRGLVVDPVRHRVTVDGEELQLRPLEFKLLALLLEHQGEVLTRQRLLQDVWGMSPEVNTRTVDTHVRRLRERLGAYEAALETVHGFGYRMREP